MAGTQVRQRRLERTAAHRDMAEEEDTEERRLEGWEDRGTRLRLYRRTERVLRILRTRVEREGTVSLEVDGRLGTEVRMVRKEAVAAVGGETTRGRSCDVREFYERVVWPR